MSRVLSIQVNTTSQSPGHQLQHMIPSSSTEMFASYYLRKTSSGRTCHMESNAKMLAFHYSAFFCWSTSILRCERKFSITAKRISETSAACFIVVFTPSLNQFAEKFNLTGRALLISHRSLIGVQIYPLSTNIQSYELTTRYRLTRRLRGAPQIFIASS